MPITRPPGSAAAWSTRRKADPKPRGFRQGDQPRPDNAEALLRSRAALSGDKQHQLAIDDFTAATVWRRSRPNRCWVAPLSYLALDKIKEAAADLDEAAQAEPQNVQIWTTRGLAYERLGDRTRPPSSYGRAIQPSTQGRGRADGFTRVGGKPGQSYAF